MILDVTLPDGTGFDVCERVEERKSADTDYILTASDEEVSIIRGLDSGGDDYITKPFKLGNCFPHPGAVASGRKFPKAKKNTSMECGDITIDLLGSREPQREKHWI